MLTFATLTSTESTVEILNNTFQSSLRSAVCFTTSMESANFNPQITSAIPIWPRGSIRNQNKLYAVDLMQFRASKSSPAVVFFPSSSTLASTPLTYTLVESSARPLLPSAFNLSAFTPLDTPALTPANLTIDDGGAAKWLVVQLPRLSQYLLSGDVLLENFITYNTQSYDRTLIVGSNPSGFPDQALRATPISVPSAASSIRVAVSCSPIKLDRSLPQLKFRFAVSNASHTSPLALNFATILTLTSFDTFETQNISLPAGSTRLHYWVDSNSASGVCQINVFDQPVAAPEIDTSFSSTYRYDFLNYSGPAYEISLTTSNPVCLTGMWSTGKPLVFGTSSSQNVFAVQLAVSGNNSQHTIVNDLRNYRPDAMSLVCVYAPNATAVSSVQVYAAPLLQTLHLNNNSQQYHDPYRIWDLSSMNRSVSTELSVQDQGSSNRIEVTMLPTGNFTSISTFTDGPVGSVSANALDQFAIIFGNTDYPRVSLNTRSFTSFSAVSSFSVEPGVYCFLGLQSFITPGQFVIDFELVSLSPPESAVTLTAAIGDITNLPLFPSLSSTQWSSTNSNLSIRANVIGSAGICVELIGSFDAATMRINNMYRDFVASPTAAITVTKPKCTEPRTYNPIYESYPVTNYSCSDAMKLRFAKVKLTHTSTVSVQSCESQDPFVGIFSLVEAAIAPQITLLGFVCQGACPITESGQISMPSQIEVTGIVSFIATDADLSSIITNIQKGPTPTRVGLTDSIISVDLCQDQFCGGLPAHLACTQPTNEDDLSASFTVHPTFIVLLAVLLGSL